MSRMKLPKLSRVGRMGRMGPSKRVPPMTTGGLTGGGVRQLNLMPEQLRTMARLIGDDRARAVWRLMEAGIVGTLPELCAYDWLQGHKIAFEFQSSQMGGRSTSGGAVVDFVVHGLSANGIYIWRIQGEYWHQGAEVERKDRIQRVGLMRLRLGGIPVVAVVDLWELDVYERFPEVFERAEAGMGLRSYD